MKLNIWRAFPAFLPLRGAPVLAYCDWIFLLLQIFVIPAQAGNQPIVRSMGYEGLDPGLHRDDG
jgi:hypothetical protein